MNERHAGRQLGQPFEKSRRLLVERLVTVDEVARDLLAIDGQGGPEEGEDEFRLGTEIEPLLVAMNEQRLLPKAVAAQDEAALVLIEKGKRPHTLASVQGGDTLVRQKLEHHLRVSTGLECPTGSFKIVAEFSVIIELAVKGDVAIAKGHRLYAAGVRVDDAEPAMEQEHGLPVAAHVLLGALAVGTAAIHESEARGHSVLRGRLGADIARNPTHDALLPEILELQYIACLHCAAQRKANHRSLAARRNAATGPQPGNVSS